MGLADLSFVQIVSLIGTYLGQFFAATWWAWAFLVIFPTARSTWLYWKQTMFEHAFLHDTIFLEMKIPRETLRSPRSMDQLFQAIAALRNAAGDLGEKYLDGEVTRWYTFEMVSFGGEIHFYMRVPKKQRPLVEAAFFSYYPEVEIAEAEDYVKKLPHHARELDSQHLDMWATEMILTKEDGYPLKTYVDFESPDEIHQVDPMAAFMENLGKVRKGEFMGIQFNLAPEGFDWGHHYEHIVENLRSPKMAKSAGHTKGGSEAELATALRMSMLQKSPGQTQVLEAVERNLSKPAFFSMIRLVYISPQNIFYDSFARRAIKGAFNQYGAGDLNSFTDNKGISTKVRPWNFPFLFPNLRRLGRRQRVLQNYMHREHFIHEWTGRILTSHFTNWNFHSRANVISSEGLASLFHPPTQLVTTAPLTKRVESKKTGAPAGLPIYAEEEVLDKFK